MDDVPIVSAEPVKIQKPRPTADQGNGKKQDRPGILANFARMTPLALVILALVYWLGTRIANYTTFPLYTAHSYKTAAALIMLWLILQATMRSLVYGTALSVVLLMGMFNTWFVDVWSSMAATASEIVPSLRAAWSNREVPYDILMSSLLSSLLLVTIGIGFLVALCTKFFFEIVFGNSWGDGRRNGYVTGIVLMIVVHLAFGLWREAEGRQDRIRWKLPDRYQPLAEFVSRIPGGVQFDGDRVWIVSPQRIQALEASTGRVVAERAIGAKLIGPAWSRAQIPVIATGDGLTLLPRDLEGTPTSIRFPRELQLPRQGPDDASGSTPVATAAVPLLIRPDVDPSVVLVRFDYGYWGAFDANSGRQRWFTAIDAPRRIDRYELEGFAASPYVISIGGQLVFSCLGGRIAAVELTTGKSLWEHLPTETKHRGLLQRAMLSKREHQVIAAYPSGHLTVLAANEKGRVIHANRLTDRNGSTRFSPATEPVAREDSVYLITGDGSFIRARIDGGEVLKEESLFANRPPLMPMGYDLAEGFAGFRDRFFRLDHGPLQHEVVHTFPAHIYATRPVCADDFVYFGTQDGWVFCLHRRSFDEKWRVHLDGELTTDSLMMAPEGLLARTRSGSVYCLAKGAD